MSQNGRKRALGARNALVVAALLLLTVGAAGCSLLGIEGSSTFDRSAEVRSTIAVLAEAGVQNDLDTIAHHLADALRVNVGGGSIAPLAAGSALDPIETVLSGVEINDFQVNVTSVHLQGDAATARGGFFLDFTDETGARLQCTGTGEAVLVHDGGKWVVTQVTIVESECTVVEPGTDPGDGPGAPGPNPDPEPVNKYQYSFDKCEYLVLGATGDQVRAVQEALALFGYYKGRIDGEYGPMTEKAVRQFQSAHGLYVDGEFGPKSADALDKALAAHGGYFRCATTSTTPYAGPTTVTKTALRKGTPFESEVLIYESPNPGPTLMFIGCIHGNERSGHLALVDAVNRGITISRGRVVVVPAFNAIACSQNRRTMNRSSSAYHGKDFNRMFPVGKNPTYAIAKEMWDLVKSQPDLAFVVDFHDGFVNSLGNTLIHSRQSEASRVAARIRDALNSIRPSGARGPKWRSFTEPIGGSLTRKVGRDLGIPAMEVELSGRNPGDPLALRKKYAWRVIQELGRAYDMTIAF